MDKYKKKYRISSARAQWWDYGWDGSYFITICTKHRKHFFGEVIDDKMILSDVGKIADASWRKLTDHAKNLELGLHVVMPNHVHGILTLVGNALAMIFVSSPALSPKQLQAEMEAGPEALPATVGRMRCRNPGKNTISTIIGGYKSAVSKEAAKIAPNFGWQGRFHDHIIRGEEEYQRIAKYINDNPKNWKKDKFA